MNVGKNEIVLVSILPAFYPTFFGDIWTKSNPLKSVLILVISMEIGMGFHTVSKDEV